MAFAIYKLQLRRVLEDTPVAISSFSVFTLELINNVCSECINSFPNAYRKQFLLPGTRLREEAGNVCVCVAGYKRGGVRRKAEGSIWLMGNEGH